ncbi:hypothetical protein [Streptomyces sp. H39-S7]|uniref:hypothetical protein n=1 Tax=Streptomyces sp. H39-S7 TaxID=3004357 RepID=UPI0022B05D96|nr:hypothetical protein [Streptomyces sp. H39-S7]MCZ4125310.1 hypothetical protein [Streptomyces sp. H39-S7]
MTENQNPTRQDETRTGTAADRTAGRIPGLNADDASRTPRADDPRKDETAAARTGEAARTTEAGRTGEATRASGTAHIADPTRTGDATRATDTTRTGDATRTSDATRTGEAARTGDATRTADTSRTGDATRTADTSRTGDAARATDATRTTEAARTGEGTGARTAETHGARHGGTAGAKDGLEERLQHAMGSFVDEPRKSVEEADAVLEQAAKQLTEKLEERRRTLRSTWQNDDTKADTEELRVALTHYRDLTQQLLSI